MQAAQNIASELRGAFIGIAREELDAHFQLNKVPGTYCVGEMLDWEAPTGGYLLTGCWTTGRWAGRAAAQR